MEDDNSNYSPRSIPLDFNQALAAHLGDISQRQNNYLTFPKSHYKPWLYQVPLSWLNRLKLHHRSGFDIRPIDVGYRRYYPQIRFNPHIRASFRHIHPRLARSLPLIYLEGYSDIVRQLKTTSYPPVIASGSAWTDNEFFKFYAAAASEHGSKLISIQHGAGYGMYLDAPSEWHEQKITDRFLSWGQTAHAISLPPKRSSSKRNGILFMATGYESKIIRFYSRQASPDQWNEYYEWQSQFLNTIQMRDEVTYRPYPMAYTHPAETKLMRIVHYDHSRSSSYAIRHAKLIIIDHLGTSLLEAMRYGIPTICFWNPLYNELRPGAQSWFKELESRHILWHDPSEAAMFINRQWPDLTEWWDHPYTESVRRGFTQHFCRTSDNWMDSWITQINTCR